MVNIMYAENNQFFIVYFCIRYLFLCIIQQGNTWTDQNSEYFIPKQIIDQKFSVIAFLQYCNREDKSVNDDLDRIDLDTKRYRHVKTLKMSSAFLVVNKKKHSKNAELEYCHVF